MSALREGVVFPKSTGRADPRFGFVFEGYPNLKELALLWAGGLGYGGHPAPHPISCPARLP